MKALSPRTQAMEDAAAEGRLLAEALAEASERYARSCHERFGPPQVQARPEDEEPDASERTEAGRLMDRPPASVQWWDLSQIALVDASLAARKWTEVKRQAEDGLRLGHRASSSACTSTSPMDLARFLALREGFVEEWQPRGGVERALIDMMAQAYTIWEHWLGIASARVVWESRTTMKEADEASRWKRPLQSEADAIALANEQADRWNRIFLRTLRQLRDLRRYSLNITAGQVNIAQQQVNVADTSGKETGSRQGTTTSK